MATTPKKSQSKKKLAAAKAETKKPAAKKKVVSPKASAPISRKSKATVTPKAKASARRNAQKADEKLFEPPFVDRALDSIEGSMKAALPAAVAVNQKLVDIAQTNMNAGMALARDLAGARSPMEMMWLGMKSWHAHMGMLHAQAQEFRSLSADLVTTANEPIRAHLFRG